MGAWDVLQWRIGHAVGAHLHHVHQIVQCGQPRGSPDGERVAGPGCRPTLLPPHRAHDPVVPLAVEQPDGRVAAGHHVARVVGRLERDPDRHRHEQLEVAGVPDAHRDTGVAGTDRLRFDQSLLDRLEQIEVDDRVAGDLGIAGHLHDEQVLSRQELVQVGQREPRREPLGQHLPHRHRVVRLQVVAGAVLDAILEQRHAPAGCQRRPHAGQHRLVLRHLVVDVGQDDPVDLAGGQLRIVDVAEHRDDAGDPFAVGEPPHDVEHLRLDVDAVDTAPWRDTPGHPARVVAGAAAHVGDDVAWLEPHRIEHRPGLLFLDAFVAFEPWRALVAHEVGRYTMPFGTLRRLGLGPRRHAAHRPDQHRQPTRKIPPALPTGARVGSHHRSHRDLPPFGAKHSRPPWLPRPA